MKCFVCRKDISRRKIEGKQAIFCEEHKGSAGSAGLAINDAIARKDWYKKDVDKGVKGKDLIQPFTTDGKYNKEFFHYHGDKAFEKYPEQKAEIKKELG